MASRFMADELIDDFCNDIPVVGLEGSLSLKHRFRLRLERMMNADIVVHEVQDSQKVTMYIRPSSESSKTTVYDERTQGFVKDLQSSLRHIASSKDGPQREKIQQDQWNAILIYVFEKTDDTIKTLRQTFEIHKDRFLSMVTKVPILIDLNEDGSSFDKDLGSQVMRLQQLSHGYDGTTKLQDEMIQFSWHMVQNCPDLAVRLQFLIGSTFSNKLYGLICDLGHSQRTQYTMIRAAVTSEILRTVEIHLGSPPSKAVKSPPQGVPARRQQQLQQQQLQQQQLQLRRAVTPAHDLATIRERIVDVIRPYLPEEDRGLGIVRLQPAQRQTAALLIGSVLSDLRVPVGSEAYYQFGFVTCRNEEEERALSHLFRQFLHTFTEPTIVFQSIIKALEFGTLDGLLCNKLRQDLKKSFPSLHQFLNGPPEERPSVHRLVQFIRDAENDEPVPCLKRDYGFRFCTQREHVTALKSIYAMVLDRAESVRLHDACRFGRLLEFANATLGYVNPSMRRLLQNDYSHPAVGFDNSQGLETYRAPLFKRSMKG